MKKIFISILFATVILCNSVQAQNIFPSTGAAGIGTTTPNASSLLEIKSTTKGFLAPRMTKAQRDAIATPATGLMIYQTNSTPGFYYYDGSAWTAVTPKNKGWSLTGNAGTNPSINFIGTTDAQSLVFKVNNTQAGYIDNSTYNTGTRNTAFGLRSLVSNTSGIENTAIGYGTLYSNQDGNNNSAFGKCALFTNSSGSYNTALGYNSMFFNTTGTNNTATGRTALQNNVTGNENTANGGSALYANNSGTDNTATGFASLYANYSGINNSAHGAYALYLNTAGQQNTATGYASLYSNNYGSYNSAHGNAALNSNDDGNWNTATGAYALYLNTHGGYNTATGGYALYNSLTGNTNVANGYGALYNNTSGNSNVAVGIFSLYNSISLYEYEQDLQFHSSNVAIGDSALFSSIDYLNETVCIGSKAYFADSFSGANTVIGFHALKNNNYAINGGYQANTVVGFASLISNVLGGKLNAFGAYVDVNNNNYIGSIAFSAYATITSNYQVRIGSIGSSYGSDPTSIGGKVGWTTLSDGRVKKNIKTNVPGLVFINKLKPVTYTIDASAIDKIIQRPAIKDRDGKIMQPAQSQSAEVKSQEQIVHTGFIAQDVEKAAKELNYDFSGVDAAKNDKDLYGLRYDEFVVPLVKAVQELSKIVDDKKAKIADLRRQVDELKQMMPAK